MTVIDISIFSSYIKKHLEFFIGPLDIFAAKKCEKYFPSRYTSRKFPVNTFATFLSTLNQLKTLRGVTMELLHGVGVELQRVVKSFAIFFANNVQPRGNSLQLH